MPLFSFSSPAFGVLFYGCAVTGRIRKLAERFGCGCLPLVSHFSRECRIVFQGGFGRQTRACTFWQLSIGFGGDYLSAA